MTLRYLKIGALAAATLAAPWAVTARGGARRAFIPTFVYRTGAYAPSGIPIADGFKDYFTLLNERDGGIEGVKIVSEECETNYDTKVGVECYERLKSKNPLMINPLLHRHHLRADPQGVGRQDPDPVHGLRPHRRGRRLGLPLDLQRSDQLLEPGLGQDQIHRRQGRRPRQAQGQEDHADLSQQPLRQGADPDARGAVEEIRLRARACSRSTIPARSRRRRGSRCVRPIPTGSSSGAGA